MIRRPTKEGFIELVSILFILLFIYASVSKLTDMSAFMMQLSKSPLLVDMVPLIAWSVPITELGIAGLLVFSSTRLIGLNLSLILMALFTWYIVAILNFSAYIPCSCGGVLGKLGWGEHLACNIVFTGLAGSAIALSGNGTCRAIRRSLAFCLSSGVAVGLLFFIKYEDENKYSSFDRKFLDTPRQTGSLDLEVNSYYFAGSNQDTIYLGNITAPRLIASVDTALQVAAPHKIEVQSDYLGSTSVSIFNSDFFLIEGVTATTYSGKTGQWKGSLIKTNAANINKAVPFTPRNFFSRVLDNATREYELERLTFNQPPVKNYDLLQKQVDGLFCVDGMMHALPERNMLIYVYYYRNQYVIMDTLLGLKYRGQSIDSVSHAKLEVKDVGERYHTVASIPLIVNKLSCTDDRLLFIVSGIRARNQTKENFAAVTTIDIYDLIERRYRGSFTVPNTRGKPRDILSKNGSLYVLAGQHICKYDLKRTLAGMQGQRDFTGQ